MKILRKQQTMNQNWYVTVNWFADIKNDNPASLPEDLYKRLIRWRKRFDVYYDIGADYLNSYDAFNRWHNKNNLTRQGTKLVEALVAHKESREVISRLKKDKNSTPDAIKTIEKLIIAIEDIIDFELTKLEITQLHMIGKAQNLSREEENYYEKQLQRKREYIESEFKQIKSRKEQKEQFSDLASSHALSKSASLFRRHENKTHHVRHITKMADEASTRIRLVAYSVKLVNLSIAPAILSSAAFVGNIFMVIPFIAGAVSATGVIAHAIKMFYDNKSTRKKAEATSLLVIAIGGLVAMGITTLSAAIASAGLIAMGIYIKQLKPIIKSFKQIQSKKRDLRACEKRLCDYSDRSLGNLEKLILLEQLESVWIESNASSNDLVKAKNIILSGKYDAHNNLLNELFHNTPPNEFIYKAVQKRRTALVKDIDDQWSEISNRALQAAISSLALAGAIVFCVFGFPMSIPVAAIITTLFFSSTLLGASLEYSWISTLKNKISEKSSDLPLEIASHSIIESTLGRQFKHEISPNNMNSNKPISAKNKIERKTTAEPPSSAISNTLETDIKPYIKKR